jgi:tRNA(fMet)-specific endonuclease VapC
LDTNIVSAPVAKCPEPNILAKLRAHPDECAIAAPVWHELTYGCARLPAGKRQEMLQTYLLDVVAPSFKVLPYDEIAASWHGHERARLAQARTPAPFVDGQIAAIAQANGLTLVTINIKDFGNFRGLELIDWSRH